MLFGSPLPAMEEFPGRASLPARNKMSFSDTKKREADLDISGVQPLTKDNLRRFDELNPKKENNKVRKHMYELSLYSRHMVEKAISTRDRQTHGGLANSQEAV